MKKILFIALPLMMLSGLLKGQSATGPDYKNIISLDIGNLIMFNYDRLILKHKHYELSGQVGFGFFPSHARENILNGVGINTYLNNSYLLKRHHFELGLGGQFFMMSTSFMAKIGYIYDISKKFGLSFYLYQWLWEEYYTENQGYGPHYLYNSHWLWDDKYQFYILNPQFTFGVYFNF